jgi:ketosteroid isomerase-like protein
MALVFAFVVGLIAPAFAQKAEIEAANSKWIEFFNKGDFTGIASLYTDDATAFPPGSAMVKGRARALCGARDRDLQPEDQGSNAAGGYRQVCRGVGEGRKRVEA